MISSLRIKNIALIKDLTIELSDGLNILSGETGAGKSIIIDSLRFVLGDRADRSLIRHGEDFASVEVVFSDYSSKANDVLDEFDIEIDDNLIIYRKMTMAGKSEARINGRQANISTVRQIVSLLVDVHTQNEHQSLLNVGNHIRLLDGFSPQICGQLQVYSALYAQYKSILERLQGFSSGEERLRRMDILQFQIAEIDEAAIADGEEDSLLNDRRKIYNFQKIYTQLMSASDSLDGINGAVKSMSQAASALYSILKYDESLANLAERAEGIKIETKDIADTLKRLAEESHYDEIALEKIDKRLEVIRKIKKKYGTTTEEITTFYQKIAAELDVLQNAEREIAELTTQLAAHQEKLTEIALRQHELRVQTAAKFEKQIISNLSDLGMKNTSFVVDIAFDAQSILQNLNAYGADRVEFLISPNLGEPLKPLTKIASGGEMSRFMLALKNIVAEIDGIDTIVFDEIDTGISGKIALTVAQKLYNIAVFRQVLAITHLPQLASMADTHYLISKNIVDSFTLTTVNSLSEQLSIAEIMRLSGAHEDSKAGYLSAVELKQASNAYKKKAKTRNPL